MMPLGDDNSTRKSVPIVTYIIIALNILFFLAELGGGEEFIKQWAFVPSRFTAHPASDWVTILTSMFMHGGLMHLAGNMLYLWIFGDNVEDRLGKIRYIFFYLLERSCPTFGQYYFGPDSSVPNLGASGAIAGILGAYLLLFPGQKVRVLLGRLDFAMPAFIVIGFWIILQFGSGSRNTVSRKRRGWVAYMADVGGFLLAWHGLAIKATEKDGGVPSRPT